MEFTARARFVLVATVSGSVSIMRQHGHIAGIGPAHFTGLVVKTHQLAVIGLSHGVLTIGLRRREHLARDDGSPDLVTVVGI